VPWPTTKNWRRESILPNIFLVDIPGQPRTAPVGGKILYRHNDPIDRGVVRDKVPESLGAFYKP
jgi:hypothetical protein